MFGAFALSERPRRWVLDQIVDWSPLEIDGSRRPAWILLFEEHLNLYVRPGKERYCLHFIYLSSLRF